MTQTSDRINEALVAHEHLAPDEAFVLSRAHAIAESMRRRRWVVRATGSAVVGAGVVVGGVGIPAWLHHSTSTNTVRIVPLDAGSSTPTAVPYTVAEALKAYFGAGYDYNDAVQLGQMWNETNLTQVKGEAGAKLLEGGTLPIPPSGPAETTQDKDVSAFLTAGYTYDDAVRLGQMWHETDITKVKAEAGAKLLDGETLPFQPSAPSQGVDPKTAAAVKEFFDAGYTYDDAVQLGKMWNETDLFQVKAEAGQKLLDGQSLPIGP